MNPLFVFLLLLFIFILAVAFFSQNNILKDNIFNINPSVEGMISFMQDVTDSNSLSKSTDMTTIPVYSATSKTIIKLHDNLFYDLKNANLIEVEGTKLKTGDTSDDVGLSINGIYVIKRDGTVSSEYMNSISCNNIKYSGSVSVNKATIGCSISSCAVVSNNVNESLILEVVKYYKQWSYTTKSNTTDQYFICYIPYDVITFVHIMDLTTKTHIMTYGIVDNTYVYVSTFNKNLTVSVTDYTEFTDNNDEKSIIEELYSSTIKVYQMSHYIKFDTTSGYLIIKSSSTTIVVYDRYGQVVSDYLKNIPTSIVKTSFGSWIVPDSAGNMVLYINLDNFTAIAIIGYDTKKSTFVLRNVKCFGNYQNNIITETTTTKKTTYSTDLDVDYYDDDYNMNDYILKTQIIPPVCPKCPSCCNGGNGVCSNCGGHGGSGVIHSTEHVLSDIGGGIKSGVHGTVDLAEDVGSGVASGVRGAADLVGDLGSDVVSGVRGTADLVGDLGSDVVSGVRGTAGLVGDLGSDAARGLRKLSTIGNSSVVDNKYINYNMPQPQNNLKPYQNQQQNLINTYNQQAMGAPKTIPGVDPYSYYGALVPKGGNGDYIPVMSDFSSFGK